MGSGREELLARIAAQEARLAELDRQRDEARLQLEDLRRSVLPEPVALDAAVAPHRLPVVDRPAPSSGAEKVRLFRRLFRGREDVFPRFWQNAKKGTKGYAPACANEWVRGACEKPRVRCGECPNKAFISVGDRIVLDHLQGRHVMGVYPLLEDETCWFLAADFDKSSWQADVSAFVETCRSAGVSVALERSRSGNGAHAWFFFEAPVPAAVAREMGCYLITETMSRRHQLAMDSYDRLFPNQDTMPKGGFGNLIALPLQHAARTAGNTVFLDHDLRPIADQWAYLASLPLIPSTMVNQVAREATARACVLGGVDGECPDGEAELPGTRQPSRSVLQVREMGPVPPQVGAVLAQRLFIEKAGLPSSLIDAIKRLAAFQNPEFYRRQRMRLSTAMTPRVIACAEEVSEHLLLPRGCLSAVLELLSVHGSALRVEDSRCEGAPLEVSFQGALTSLQEEAAKALLQHDTGVFVAPPGTGKTVLATHLIAKRARSTLVLVHRQPLLDQWVAQLAMFLGVPEKEIGRIGGGRRKPGGRIDVATIQSLSRDGRVDDIVATYGHVIVDECHHVPAVSFERVLSEIKARYVLGLTATPRRRDGHDPILAMQLGPVRFAVDAKAHAAARPFRQRLVVRDTTLRVEGDPSIQEIYGQIASDEERNLLLLDDVIHAITEGRRPILLTERRDHLEALAGRLRGIVRHVVVLHGGMTPKARRDAVARLGALPDGEERVVVATGRYVGEGFDDPRLDTLFLAMPLAWKGTLVQYAGRLHRLHPGKTEVRIVDYVDRNVPVLQRMSEKRLRTYRAIGYTRTESLLSDAEHVPELEVEYDDDAVQAADGWDA